MNTTTEALSAGPGWLGRFRSRQSGHPSGVIGRGFGRAMVKDTAASNDRAIELLELDAPSVVLDLGCGQGRTVETLVRAGHRSFGVDPSPTMVQQARDRNRRAVVSGDAEILLSDGRVLPLADESVDAVLTAHTVYFMADPAVTFAEVARVLRPGGRFVAVCHVGDDPPPAWVDPAVYRIPTSNELHALLHRARLTVADVGVLDGNDAWPTRWFVADLAEPGVG